MKYFSILLASFLGLSLPVGGVYAHMYDSIGVEAEPHSHEGDATDSRNNKNCFIDPKFGEICK